MKAKTTKMAGLGVLFLFLAGATTVTAEHVDPTFVPFTPGPPPECSDFNESWIQLKVDPPVDGNHTDGTLNVTLDVEEGEDDPISFDWESNMGVSAVLVVDGAHGHHLYEYDPASMGDDGLTAGPHKDSGKTIDNISHINFCYTEGDEPNGEEPPNGETPPRDFECPPVSLSAIAHGDSTITVNADGLNGSAELQRSAGGGAFVKVADMDATSTSYFDTDTEVGVTYTYQLLIEGEVCAEVEVTAIPVFGLIGAALATGLGVLGYVGLRRRS